MSKLVHSGALLPSTAVKMGRIPNVEKEKALKEASIQALANGSTHNSCPENKPSSHPWSDDHNANTAYGMSGPYHPPLVPPYSQHEPLTRIPRHLQDSSMLHTAQREFPSGMPSEITPEIPPGVPPEIPLGIPPGVPPRIPPEIPPRIPPGGVASRVSIRDNDWFRRSMQPPRHTSEAALSSGIQGSSLDIEESSAHRTVGFPLHSSFSFGDMDFSKRTFSFSDHVALQQSGSLTGVNACDVTGYGR